MLPRKFLGKKIIVRLLEDLMGRSSVHHVVIEAPAMEGNYQSLKKVVRQEGGEEDFNAGVKGFKSLLTRPKWLIVDFDGFMKGNAFTSDANLRV